MFSQAGAGLNSAEGALSSKVHLAAAKHVFHCQGVRKTEIDCCLSNRAHVAQLQCVVQCASCHMFCCTVTWLGTRQKSHGLAVCVQIHWPVTGNMGTQVVPSIQETWRAMEKLVKDVS